VEGEEGEGEGWGEGGGRRGGWEGQWRRGGIKNERIVFTTDIDGCDAVVSAGGVRRKEGGGSTEGGGWRGRGVEGGG
jgi:hypothetical protein